MQKKRICVFCQKWESGGIESFLHNVLSRIDMSAFDVDLVVEEMAESVFTQPLLARGVRFFKLSGAVRDIWGNNREFRRLLSQRAYDVVWLNVYQGLALRYLRLAKCAGVGVRVAHSHNTALRASVTRWIKLWLHRCCSRLYAKDATAFWGCSEVAAKFMFPSALLRERGYSFIPNGIHVERFRFDPTVRETVRRELGLNDRFVIGDVGRLCYQKNQSFLLDVLVETQKIHPESRLLLVGDGEDRKMLEEKARTLGIADHVIFYGTTNRVEKLFWAMDVFAFPSRFEGLGIVAVEAQAAGLPVVCSEHVPPEAFVTPNIQSLPLDSGAQAWTDVLLDCACRDRGKAHELVRGAGFDVADIVRDIMILLGKRDEKYDNGAAASL